MALDIGGLRAESERAYEWLAGLQRPDGAWHQYYVADDAGDGLGRAGQARRQRVRLHRLRRVAPLPAPQGRRLPRVHVADGRAGDRLRARPADAARRDPLGPSRRRLPVDLRAAHRLVVASATRCAPPSASPTSSATSDPTGSAPPPPSATSWPTCPRRSRPSTAGPWTGTTRCWPAPSPASGAAPTSRTATTPSPRRTRASAASRTAPGSPPPRRASAPSPTWRSACATGPSSCSPTPRRQRLDDGRYWTGIVYPAGGPLPRRRDLDLLRRRRAPRRRGPARRDPGGRALRRPRRRAARAPRAHPRRHPLTGRVDRYHGTGR